jgi:hypothetical protein
MSELRRITVDPNQCGGRPCLRGSRIRVKDVLDLLADGAQLKSRLRRPSLCAMQYAVISTASARTR